MRLRQLASHGVKGGACDETEPIGWSRWVRGMRLRQLDGHGGKIGACDEPKPVCWSRWVKRNMCRDS